MKVLDLKKDTIFKSFMMSKNTNNYKAKLIHLITGISEIDLKKAVYQSIEHPISNSSDKVYKTDIITTVKNHILSLEMNKKFYEDSLIKNSDYRSKIISESLKSGESYQTQRQVIQINFDNYHIYKGDRIIYEFRMREKETLEEEYRNSSISYHVDLENLKRYNKDDELKKLLEIFISEDIDKLRGSKEMDEAIEELERLSQDENIIGLYDAELLQEKHEKSIREEGLKEGINQEKIEIAKNLLKMNMKIEDISKATNLSVEKIDKLR